MDPAASARFDQEVLKYMDLAAAAGRKAADGTITADTRKKYLDLGRVYRAKALAALKASIAASAETA